VKYNAYGSLAQNGPSAPRDIPINRSRIGSTFGLSKFFESGMVKCIIEMQGLGTGENASRIKQVAFHLSDIAATVWLVV
jgi:hypothetical protein